MTIEEIRSALPCRDAGDVDEIVCTEDKTISIRMDRFMGRFGDAELTHHSLVSHPNTDEGWRAIYDNWRSRRLIQ